MRDQACLPLSLPLTRLLLLPLVMLAAPVSGQELDLYRAGLPESLERRVRSIAADPATTHFRGDATIAHRSTIEGNVLVTDGVLRIEGVVRGEIVAVDASLVFDAGARVDGDVTVVRGTVSGEDVAGLSGSVTVYNGGDALWDRARRSHDRRRRDWRGEDWGHADVRVTVAGNYNRVEGLPLAFGPDIRTGGRMPTRIEALAIWRTDVGPLTDSRPMGYIARVEQFLGGRDVRLGASVRSATSAIESWSVTDLEASLAAGLFHEDQRDYYEREGWSVYARLAPRRSPLDVTIEYRDEEHASLAPRDPWTLFNGDRPWREQPLVGEGALRSIGGALEVDATRGHEFARRGWYVRADVSHALDSELRLPGGEQVESGFTTGTIDVRRYQRAGHAGILGLRVVAGGNAEKGPIAPQFQQALGGAGSLPGYSLFAADCGARDALVTVPDPGGESDRFFFPAYGCDRVALFQAEFRGGFDFRIDPWDDHEWRVDTGVEWTVFFDAGRGWSYDASGADRRDTGTLYDVGAGLVLGGLGIYGAVPLRGESRDLRLFVRLGPRF